MNLGLHYTKGDGYYQEYKDGRSLVEYGLKPFMLEGEEVAWSDLIRKKAMDNGFGEQLRCKLKCEFQKDERLDFLRNDPRLKEILT